MCWSKCQDWLLDARYICSSTVVLQLLTADLSIMIHCCHQMTACSKSKQLLNIYNTPNADTIVLQALLLIVVLLITLLLRLIPALLLTQVVRLRLPSLLLPARLLACCHNHHQVSFWLHLSKHLGFECGMLLQLCLRCGWLSQQCSCLHLLSE